ncbi:MAG TPA: hypothetical protein PK873_14390 [Pseudomonas sp.]|uniref:hypothetical protein n=1 Tax=Pseudomonas sp. TaxID=306 RepID=UPI002BECED1E|nr:hypothetical protein [Pseudomonas sp.]HRL94738.1 hypothetical protein [Pseudomonas sp.]
MSEELKSAIAVLSEATCNEQPTMFWDQAMKHVAVLLKHIADPFIGTPMEFKRMAPESLRDVLAERIRQIQQRGFHPEHDDEHTDGSLSRAAVCYVEEACSQIGDPDRALNITRLAPDLWPWDDDDWKPSGAARRNLVKAAALILAEVDRIDRAIALKLENTPHG